jgi:hypothetical protein
MGTLEEGDHFPGDGYLSSIPPPFLCRMGNVEMASVLLKAW